MIGVRRKRGPLEKKALQIKNPSLVLTRENGTNYSLKWHNHQGLSDSELNYMKTGGSDAIRRHALKHDGKLPLGVLVVYNGQDIPLNRYIHTKTVMRKRDIAS